MIQIKSKTVNLDNVSRHIYYAISVAAEVYEGYGVDLVITSVRDSKHSEGSFHYIGFAFDIRVWNLPKEVDYQIVSNQIAKELGDDYDVIFEVNHIHCEYDPKD